MNFNSLHPKRWNARGVKLVVLSCFMMLFVGLQSASAQYISADKAIVQAKKQLTIMEANPPARTTLSNGLSAIASTSDVTTYKIKVEYLKHTIEKIKGEGLSVGAAILVIKQKMVAKNPQNATEINAVEAQIDELLRL